MRQQVDGPRSYCLIKLDQWLINSMVTELIRPVSYNPGRSQKLIKLEKAHVDVHSLSAMKKVVKLKVILPYISHSCL